MLEPRAIPLRMTAPTLALVVALALTGCARSRTASAVDWQRFGARLAGKLTQPQSLVEPCRTDGASAACTATFARMKNPFYIQDHAGDTQSTGWLGAWSAAPSAHVVAATRTLD